MSRSSSQAKRLAVRAETAAPAIQAEVARVQARSVAHWLAPAGLGLAQVVAVCGLIFVALAAPPHSATFRGISNDTASSGSLRRLALFRGADHWIPGLSSNLRPNLSPTVYLWGLRAALIALAVIQLAALLTVLRQGDGAAPVLAWLAGPIVTAICLLAYPPLSSDVFYYAISGHVANLGANPYLHVPNDFPADPFLQYNDWRTITSPYGPLWTSISRGVIHITGADPVRAVVGFKLVAALGAFGCAGLVYALARRLTPNRTLALGAVILVSWQPALLMESAGTAHNDAVMVCLALAGLLLIASGRNGGMRGGLVLIAAAAAIKYVMLPLLGFALLWRLADRHTRWRKLIRLWLLDLVAIGLVAVAVFAPYWAGEQTIESMVKEPARLFVNPFWVLPRLSVIRFWGKNAGLRFRDNTEQAAIWLTVAILVVTTLWLLVRLFQLRRRWPGLRPEERGGRRLRLQALSWAAGMAAIALIPVNAHAWYAIWAIGPVALAWVAGPGRLRLRRHPLPNLEGSTKSDGDSRSPQLTWWLLLYLVWTAISFIVYHTRAPGPHGLL